MKRKSVVGLAALATVVCVLCLSGNTAQALPAFKKEFEEKYVKKDSSDPVEKEFAEKYKKVEYCGVCHSDKKDRKKRNKYGEALDPLLDKMDAKDAKKIQEALDKVAEMKSDPDDDTSKTYGELIKLGILPAGDPE